MEPESRSFRSQTSRAAAVLSPAPVAHKLFRCLRSENRPASLLLCSALRRALSPFDKVRRISAPAEALAVPIPVLRRLRKRKVQQSQPRSRSSFLLTCRNLDDLRSLVVRPPLRSFAGEADIPIVPLTQLESLAVHPDTG